jgi:hypothetical protein
MRDSEPVPHTFLVHIVGALGPMKVAEEASDENSVKHTQVNIENTVQNTIAGCQTLDSVFNLVLKRLHRWGYLGRLEELQNN